MLDNWWEAWEWGAAIACVLQWVFSFYSLVSSCFFKFFQFHVCFAPSNGKFDNTEIYFQHIFLHREISRGVQANKNQLHSDLGWSKPIQNTPILEVLNSFGAIWELWNDWMPTYTYPWLIPPCPTPSHGSPPPALRVILFHFQVLLRSDIAV